MQTGRSPTAPSASTKRACVTRSKSWESSRQPGARLVPGPPRIPAVPCVLRDLAVAVSMAHLNYLLVFSVLLETPLSQRYLLKEAPLSGDYLLALGWLGVTAGLLWLPMVAVRRLKHPAALEVARAG